MPDVIKEKIHVWNVRYCCPQPSFEYTAKGKPKGRCFGCDTKVKIDNDAPTQGESK